MNLRTIEFHVAETATNIRRNGLASFAAITNCTLSLAVLGVFILGGWNIRDKAVEIASSVRIVIHMRRDIDLPTTERLAEELKQRYPSCIRSIEVVSADEAFDRFKRTHPELAAELDKRPNPLGPQIEVRLNNPEDYVPIVNWAKQNPSVDEARYGQAVLETLARFRRIGGWLAGLMLVVLTMASMLTISNTIRLTIHARRKEISIMQMVGATSGFIKTPFVLEGMFDGVMGALIGLALLFPAYLEVADLLSKTIPALAPTVTSPAQLATVGGALVGAGALFGFVGSYIAVQKYLTV